MSVGARAAPESLLDKISLKLDFGLLITAFNSLTPMDGCDHPLLNELFWWLVSSPIFIRCQCLIARKVCELFHLKRGIWPFYTAFCFDELSRGYVSCLLNASFKTAISQHHNLGFYAKINDHGIHRGDTGQILTQWRHVVASRVVLDLLYWYWVCTKPFSQPRDAAWQDGVLKSGWK